MVVIVLAKNLLEREDGPTAVEYAVMLCLIVVACISTIGLLGGNAQSVFTGTGSALRGGNNAIGSQAQGGSQVSGGIWQASAGNGENGTQTDTYNASTGEGSYSYSGGTSNSSGTFSGTPGQLPTSQVGIGASQTWTRIK